MLTIFALIITFPHIKIIGLTITTSAFIFATYFVHGIWNNVQLVLLILVFLITWVCCFLFCFLRIELWIASGLEWNGFSMEHFLGRNLVLDIVWYSWSREWGLVFQVLLFICIGFFLWWRANFIVSRLKYFTAFILFSLIDLIVLLLLKDLLLFQLTTLSYLQALF